VVPADDGDPIRPGGNTGELAAEEAGAAGCQGDLARIIRCDVKKRSHDGVAARRVEGSNRQFAVAVA